MLNRMNVINLLIIFAFILIPALFCFASCSSSGGGGPSRNQGESDDDTAIGDDDDDDVTPPLDDDNQTDDDVSDDDDTSDDDSGDDDSASTDDDSAAPPDLLAITVLPDFQAVPVGLTYKFTAIGIYSDLPNQVVTPNWKTDDPDVATVDSDGTVHGVMDGKATLTAEYYDMKANAQIIVAPDTLLLAADGSYLSALNVGSKTFTGEYIELNLGDAPFSMSTNRETAVVANTSSGQGLVQSFLVFASDFTQVYESATSTPHPIGSALILDTFTAIASIPSDNHLELYSYQGGLLFTGYLILPDGSWPTFITGTQSSYFVVAANYSDLQKGTWGIPQVIRFTGNNAILAVADCSNIHPVCSASTNDISKVAIVLAGNQSVTYGSVDVFDSLLQNSNSYPIGGFPSACAINQDKVLYVGFSNGAKIVALNVSTGEFSIPPANPLIMPSGTAITSIGVHPDYGYLIVGTNNGKVYQYSEEHMDLEGTYSMPNNKNAVSIAFY